MFFLVLFYTMFKTPPLFQTEPEGKPNDDVGIVLIERLFTNVVHSLSAIIPTPIIIAPVQQDVFPHPPNIAEFNAFIQFIAPPPINELIPETLFVIPEKTDELQADAILLLPPPTILKHPLAVF